MTISNILH